MTFTPAWSSLAILASIVLSLGCSPVAAQSKAPKVDAGRAQSPRPPKAAASDELRSPTSSGAISAPKLSPDPCKKDDDCAPAAMCHPDKCVGVTNAGAMSPEMMCSMECRPGTVDCNYNHCACVASSPGKKVCALVPGPRAKR